MKRATLLSLSILLIAGCSNDKAEYLCGNGKLDSNELCDGTQIAEGLQILCSNGVKPNRSAVTCTAQCSLDMTAACNPVCGNGIVEGDEQCDTTTPTIIAGCDNPDWGKLSCTNCKLIDSGVCPATAPVNPPKVKPDWIPEHCGNDILDPEELCDGIQIADEARICPKGMIPKKSPVFKCLDSCRLVDISEACIDTSGAVCGNGVADPGEACDKEAFAYDAFDEIQCPDGYKIDATKATCNADCQVENACVKKINDEAGVLFSEIVPHLFVSGDSMALDGLALELTNMSKTAFDLTPCSIALINESGIQKTIKIQPPADSSTKVLSSFETTVICSQKDTDKFDGACNTWIESESDDSIIDNLAGMSLIGLVCGENNDIVDLINLNSFITAVERDAVDFTRYCDASAVTESKNALMGEGWHLTADTTYAPKYGLGSHCEMIDSDISGCKYTISRNDLTDRSQSIDLALEITIPGVTDKTDQTDDGPATQIQFIVGKVKNNTVSESIIHIVYPKADPEWTNDQGIDRYIGTLRNWDTYDGFLDYDAGTYVLDAAISLDSGQTRIFCGPKGIIRHYDNYDPTQRNTLTVSYNDEDGTCNDGVISPSEVCDGRIMRPETLVCENTKQDVADVNAITCGCQTLSTLTACKDIPSTCGNGTVEEGEACDGTDIPDSAKVCPNGYAVMDNPVWECTDSCLRIDHFKACEPACGNGKLEDTEICDDSLFSDDAKVCPKDYVIVDSPQWACNGICSAVITDNACELACGNQKLDNAEICDGTLYDYEADEAKCKDGVYDKSRASCLSTCVPDGAACIPNIPLVFDEYIAHTDDKGNVDGVAITIANTGDTDYDAGNCNLWIYNDKGTLAMMNAYSMTHYSLLAIAQTEESNYMLNQCKPLAFSTENMSKEEIYHNVFDSKTTTLGVYDENQKLLDNFLMNESVAKMRITCDGITVDAFDAKGMREAIKKGYTHGKLKASDRRPWSSMETVKLENRMDLDKTYPIESMLSPCE